VSLRKNGIVIDEDGPWTAACYLAEDSSFAGRQHGVLERGSLCGLAGDAVVVVRNRFLGTGPRDCPDCARRLRELAE